MAVSVDVSASHKPVGTKTTKIVLMPEKAPSIQLAPENNEIRANVISPAESSAPQEKKSQRTRARLKTWASSTIHNVVTISKDKVVEGEKAKMERKINRELRELTISGTPKDVSKIKRDPKQTRSRRQSTSMDPCVLSAMVSISPRGPAPAPAPFLVQPLQLVGRQDTTHDALPAVPMSADASLYVETYDSASGGCRRGRPEGLWVRGNLVSTRHDRSSRVATANARMMGLLDDPNAKVSDMRRTLIRYGRYQSADDCRDSWLALQEKLNLVLAEEADGEARRTTDKQLDETIVEMIISLVDAGLAREAIAVRKAAHEAQEEQEAQEAQGAGGWSPTEDSLMFFSPERRRRSADTGLSSVCLIPLQPHGVEWTKGTDSPTATPVSTPLGPDDVAKVWA